MQICETLMMMMLASHKFNVHLAEISKTYTYQ
jgi:hypothetical protein